MQTLASERNIKGTQSTICNAHIVSRYKTAQGKYNAYTTTCRSESRTSTLPEISRIASVRPEESAPLVSRATNLDGTRTY
jgi:hypothetical protein